jgi:predicted phage terminase large subunit-like protein
MRDMRKLYERVAQVLTPATFARFVSGGRWSMAPHLAAIDRAIVDTIEGRTAPILVIEAPPRHGKSELISRYLPAWYLGRYPDRRVMLAGYGASFARGWGRKARGLLAEHGDSLFGVEIDRGVSASADWGLSGNEGGMVTAGTGGPLTGRGAHLLIIDDPIKNSDQARSQTICDNHWDWWQTTASTRIEPGGCTIIIATRWCMDDLSGRLIDAAKEEGGPPVRRLRLPAIAEEDDPLGRAPGEALWPARWPVERLERMRASKEAHWWQAMYQQNPPQSIGSLWPESYFGEHLWTDDFPHVFEQSALAVDPATGTEHGDYTAIVFVGSTGGTLWVDASLVRQTPEDAIGTAIDMAQQYDPHFVALESNLFQSLLAPEFDRQCRERRIPPLPIYPLEQRVPKRIRIERLGPYLLRRKLKFRRNKSCQTIVEQLQRFPADEHDDGPDALELAIRLVLQQSGSDCESPDFTVEFAQP